jgi:hypothetical protein
MQYLDQANTTMWPRTSALKFKPAEILNINRKEITMNKTDLKEALMAQGYDELLTVRECADIFKTSKSHIYQKITAGVIPASDNAFTGKKLVLLDDVCEELATEKVGA